MTIILVIVLIKPFSNFVVVFYIRIYIIFERHSNSLPRYQDLNVYRLRPVTLDGGVGLKQLRAV